jgi:hypothetical protein
MISSNCFVSCSKHASTAFFTPRISIIVRECQSLQSTGMIVSRNAHPLVEWENPIRDKSPHRVTRDQARTERRAAGLVSGEKGVASFCIACAVDPTILQVIERELDNMSFSFAMQDYRCRLIMHFASLLCSLFGKSSLISGTGYVCLSTPSILTVETFFRCANIWKTS